ncbi:AAA family ATPase [Natrarchaeobius halalkaliphilus]|uniref:AAA family ATPase n=1 Tax=Natrarchaeobius halalkaliphilus TaxID=1679091 RepID=A0A3N6MV36_9EURY|nr:AAA family ATPase [Natrarchaeobius halalkaliphilus]RQG89282.1 AAA family ATPase [Natrarchaeobius halalkaliphilus]
MNAAEAARTCDAVFGEIQTAVVGEHDRFETILTAVVGQGHVLLEDVPGTGKTLTARTLATALDLEFSRIQFTPDLLPADITGTHVYDEHAGRFEFEAGPIFANVVLADEINRAPPKTQAALLEAMGEKQVSTGGETRTLPEPFFVIATQNPVEQEGTFPLPEAQIDRFMIKTTMGYPDRDGELELLDRRASRRSRTPNVSPVIDRESVLSLQSVPESVAVEPEVREYLVDICRSTREDDRVDVGISPRGVQRLFEATRARAAIVGRDYVAPEDVHAIVHPVLDHRIVLTTESDVRGVDPTAVVETALNDVSVPSMSV